MVKKIIKRDGRIVPFDQTKILNAISKAVERSEEEVKIGEYSGVYIDWGKEGVDYGSVIWADDDYVLELYGNLTKDELLYLANGTKSLGK